MTSANNTGSTNGSSTGTGNGSGTGTSAVTQVDVATEALRRAIVNGIIAPGERVKEQEFAASLNMSRTPVREAVRRLVGEGILVQVPNAGATVASWSQREVEEIFEIRALLEGYAAALASQKVTPDRAERLVDLCAQMRALEDATGEQQWDDYAVLNDQFHREIFGLSENHQLCLVLNGLLGVPLLHRSFQGHTADAIWRSNRQHEEIVSAIEAEDRTWAESAMRVHIHATRHLLVGKGAGDELHP